MTENIYGTKKVCVGFTDFIVERGDLEHLNFRQLLSSSSDTFVIEMIGVMGTSR